MRVLLVDDSPAASRMVASGLRTYGHRVDAVLAGADALRLVREERYDVVIVDQRVADMTGVELCWHLRSQQGARHVYVMVMIPGSQTDSYHELIEAGADEFLRKPIDMKWLDARLLAASRVVLMQRDLERLATTDALTGVLNRRRFMERGGEEFARARRYARPLSVAMLDIDHFKRINDTYGHASGDDAIRLSARACAAALRQCDVVGRLGGEEFAILMPETPPEGAYVVMERLRARLAEAVVPKPEVGGFRLTVSIGVACAADGDATVEQVLARADAALYRAKSGGRNRVEAEPATPGPSEEAAVL